MMSQFEASEIAFERETAILVEIKKNPHMHHNALIKLIVPTHMAKTTFERTKNRMIEKNMLSVLQKGNKKIYQITENYHEKSQQLLERITHENYQQIQHQIHQ